MHVGISAFATYIPSRVQTSQYLADASGIPREVLEEKFGIMSKPWAADGEQVSAMAVCAAKAALNGSDPKTIDVVIWTGSEHKDFPLWSAGPKVQHEIGAVNAWSTDVASRCASTQVGLKFAKDMMVADPRVKKVLLAGGHRMIDKLNYKNERTRFMFNMSDAGSAILLERDAPRNQLFETVLLTDGSFSEDVYVTGGGTRVPLTKENFDPAMLTLEVPHPAAMKERLDKLSMRNFISTIEQSVTRSGFSVKDIGYLAIIHMKRSAHEAVLNELGLKPEQSTYLEHFGHAGAPDVVRSLELGVQQGKLRDGDIAVLCGAGTGYIWASSCVRWGPVFN
jgi:3-oxoacyl-[acyl-carrier-protein] synthase-3